MNKKSIIQILVIVLAFAAAAFVLYKGGLFGSPQSAAPAGSPGAMGSESGSADILPQGDTLNFDQAILPKRFEYNQIQYPKLNPKTEVGIPETNIITPLPSAEK